MVCVKELRHRNSYYKGYESRASDDRNHPRQLNTHVTKLWNKMTILISLIVFASLLQTADAAITAWDTPSITTSSDGNGTLSVPENQALSTTIETYDATTDSMAAVSYSLLTTGTPFDVDSTGKLTITTALDYETTTHYTIEIKAVDGAGSGTATIAVTVTDENDNNPTFASATHSVCVDNGLTQGSSVYAITATDADTVSTPTYTISLGNTNSDFTYANSRIEVASGQTLDMTTTSYELELEADDTVNTVAKATISVTVGGCNTAITLVVSILALSLSLVTVLC